MKYNDLTVGTEIYYSGDQANVEGFGAITGIGNGWYGKQYEITMEDGRIKKAILPMMFEASVGKRFHVRYEYEADRNAKLEELFKKHA